MEIEFDKSGDIHISEQKRFTGKLSAADLCRLCANTDNQLIPIFRGEGLEHNIPSIIEKHLPIINISESDNIPLQICYQCASTLILWHSLYEGCPIADKRLHEILDNKYQDISTENNYVSLNHNFKSTSLTNENTNRLGDFLDDNYGAKFPSAESLRQTLSILPNDNLIVNVITDEPVDDERLKTVEAQVADTSQEKYVESKSMEHKTSYMCSYPNCHQIYSTTSTVIQHGMCDHNGNYGAESWYQVINQCNYCHVLFLNEFDVHKHITLVHATADETRMVKEKEMMLKSMPTSEQFHQKREYLSDENCQVKSKNKLSCRFCNKTFHNSLSLGQHVLGYHVISNEIIKPVKSGGEIYKNINRRGLVDPAESHNEVQRQVQLVESGSVLAIVEPEELEVFDGDDVIKIVEFDNPKNVNEETIFECDVCGRSFPKKRYLMLHKQRGHIVRAKRITFECDVCKESLISKRSLMTHQQRHMKTTFECDVCGQGFDRKISLIGHLRSHTHKLDIKATFKCDVCSKSLTSKRNLMAHQQRHMETTFECDVCGQSFDKKINVIRHLRVHSHKLGMEAPFECDVCSKSFANKTYLMNHQRRHADLRYMCEYCGKTFCSETDLSEHLCQPSKSNKRFECGHCGRHLSSKFSMTKHLQLHSGEKPFRCSKCELSFTYHSSWKAHQLMHEPDLKQKCHLCPKAFRYKHSLDLHLMRWHNPNGKMFKCDQCNKTFCTKQILINHAIVHVSERPFSCSVCSSKFKKKSYLNIHKLRYHNNLEKQVHLHSQQMKLLKGIKTGVRNLTICQPGIHENLRTTIQGKWAWKCDNCEYYSHFRHRFVNHYRRHTGEKPYMCTICGKCFGSKTSLLQHKYSWFHNRGTSLKCDACGDYFHKIKYKLMHVHRIHNSSNCSLKCDMCGESLPDKKSLIDHIQSHTGGRSHMCSKCGASFIYSSSLKFHQLVHQVHNCHLCSKLLRSKQALNYHLQRHTGDLNFKCDQCDKAFYSQSHLALHKFVHSDVRPFKCTKCGVILKYKKNWERHMKSHKKSENNLQKFPMSNQ